MAFTYEKLAVNVKLGTTATTLHDNPTGKKTYVRLIELHNTNTAAVDVKLYNVPAAAGAVGTAADADNRFYAESLAAGATRFIEFPAPGKILDALHDSLQGIANTADKVLVSAYGGQDAV